MEYDTIFNSVRNIMRRVFDDNKLEINDSTSARDIRRWDSLNHVILIAEVEKSSGYILILMICLRYELPEIFVRLYAG